MFVSLSRIQIWPTKYDDDDVLFALAVCFRFRQAIQLVGLRLGGSCKRAQINWTRAVRTRRASALAALGPKRVSWTQIREASSFGIGQN